ncbi:MAG: isoprenylcysteine carboxylmethyltransferase family protein [Acidobacteria bacterium]|nr:isoprenylcysteine carboxylmethyltransferase family protein [Acidobacteriota bacterium]
MWDSYSKVAARIRVPTGFLLGAIYLIFAEPATGRLWLGATVSLVGLLLRAISSGYVAKNQRLATDGPYAYVRHPLYLGSTVAGVGFCIAGGRWWFFFLLGIILAGIYWPVIRREEEHIRRLFPEEFASYAQRVPMLWPWPAARPEVAHSQQGFAWKLYWKNREYRAFLAFVGIMFLLIGKMVLWGTR